MVDVRDNYIKKPYISAGIVNLGMDPETHCFASSHLDSKHKCSNVYDGKVEPMKTQEWSSVTAKGS